MKYFVKTYKMERFMKTDKTKRFAETYKMESFVKIVNDFSYQHYLDILIVIMKYT